MHIRAADLRIIVITDYLWIIIITDGITELPFSNGISSCKWNSVYGEMMSQRIIFPNGKDAATISSFKTNENLTDSELQASF